MKIDQTPSSRGFTLVELMVVIAIIAILVTLTASVVFRFRKHADKVLTTNNIKQIQSANTMYAGDHNGLFVPPTATVDGIDYEWFENPEFISQIKGETATYVSGGDPDVSLQITYMDPIAVKTRVPGYKTLGGSYGYTTPSDSAPSRQSQIIDASRTAAFITASAPHADFGSKGNIAYRHSNKAIVAYFDAHVEYLRESEIDEKLSTDAFWPPVKLLTP